MDIFSFVFVSSSLFLFYFVFSDAADRIIQSQSLSDGTNLVSENGGFDYWKFKMCIKHPWTFRPPIYKLPIQA